MLIGSSRAIRVWAWPEPVDLRRGFDGLYALVRKHLGKDPLSGELFLFHNVSRRSCKVLFWDGTGLCLFSKRLERGRFAALRRSELAQSVQLTASELTLYIEGSNFVGAAKLSPEVVVPNRVVVRSET